MKTFFKLIVFVFFMGILMVPVAVVVMGLEKTAAVAPHEKLTFDKVSRVKKLVDKSRPVHLRKRQIQTFRINENDLNLLIDYGLSQSLKSDTVFAAVRLLDNMATADVTMVLPSNPLGDYLNVSIDIKSDGRVLTIVSVKVGKVFIPGWMINPVLDFLHEKGLAIDGYRDLLENIEAIKNIIIQPEQMQIVYDWNPDTLARLQKSSKRIFLPENHQKRLVVYANRLEAILTPYRRKKVSLVRIMPVMFEHARKQSEKTDDPIAENRAVIQVLALYSNGTHLSQFVSKKLQKNIKLGTKSYLILKNRTDLPKHFLVSAGLAVSAGSQLANFIGLVKEVDDAAGGTGFSFADLAADRAGVRLAELAISSKQSAYALQAKMMVVQSETHFMPAIDHLPEGIMRLEFKKKYTDLDSKSYHLVNREIDKRIKLCRAYH